MLFDFGATWTLVGHSERRRDPAAGESDEAVAAKARHATAVGLSAIACVGESAEERDAGHGIKVITRQLAALANEVTHWEALALAYEPVWAIGTGHIASLEHVQEARRPRVRPPPASRADVAAAVFFRGPHADARGAARLGARAGVAHRRGRHPHPLRRCARAMPPDRDAD